MNKYSVSVDTVFVVEADNEEQALEFVKNNAVMADIDSDKLPWYDENVFFTVQEFA